MKFNTFLILLVISFNTIQCRKDIKLPYCEEFPEDCVEIMKVKDHFYFDVGTYWVYEEETTGQLDSQWVSEAHTFSNVCWFDYRIKSSIMSHYFNIETTLLANAIDSGLIAKNNRAIILNRAKTKPGGFIGSSLICTYPYEIGVEFNNYGGYLALEKILDSYIVSNKLFVKVLKVTEESNISEQNQTTTHYYAENVGLIRKELIDSNKIWNLIRYKIVK